MRATVRVGNVEVTAIRDKAHDFDPHWHFPEVPSEAWDPYTDLISGSEGYVLVNFGCYLVRDEERTILIDTGWGPELGPPGAPEIEGALLGELAAMGLGVGDIDQVVFTHLHADHVGWNLVETDAGPAPRFVNARYQVPELDWTFFRDKEDLHPNIRRQALPLGELDVMDLFSDGAPITLSVTAEGTPGHTPGHSSFVIASGGERLFILGDVIHHPVIAEETKWLHRFDVDAELAVHTRGVILDRLEAEGTLVAAGHLRHPTFGHFVRRDGKRHWRPINPALYLV